MYYDLEAIILRRENLREDGLLITVYSRERGKLKLQARGAKKIKSKLAGHLEPVSLSNLSVTRGKNTDQLIGAQMMESFIGVKSDVLKLGYAGWMMEAVDKLTVEDHAESQVFELLYKALKRLDGNNGDIKIMRISFGFKLLDLLGFSPVEKGGDLIDLIKYIINNKLEYIFDDQEICQNLGKLNKILNNELEDCVEGELESNKFLSSVV